MAKNNNTQKRKTTSKPAKQAVRLDPPPPPDPANTAVCADGEGVVEAASAAVDARTPLELARMQCDAAEADELSVHTFGSGANGEAFLPAAEVVERGQTYIKADLSVIEILRERESSPVIDFALPVVEQETGPQQIVKWLSDRKNIGQKVTTGGLVALAVTTIMYNRRAVAVGAKLSFWATIKAILASAGYSGPVFAASFVAFLSTLAANVVTNASAVPPVNAAMAVANASAATRSNMNDAADTPLTKSAARRQGLMKRITQEIAANTQQAGILNPKGMEMLQGMVDASQMGPDSDPTSKTSLKRARLAIKKQSDFYQKLLDEGGLTKKGIKVAEQYIESYNNEPLSFARSISSLYEYFGATDGNALSFESALTALFFVAFGSLTTLAVVRGAIDTVVTNSYTFWDYLSGVSKTKALMAEKMKLVQDEAVKADLVLQQYRDSGLDTPESKLQTRLLLVQSQTKWSHLHVVTLEYALATGEMEYSKAKTTEMLKEANTGYESNLKELREIIKEKQTDVKLIKASLRLEVAGRKLPPAAEEIIKRVMPASFATLVQRQEPHFQSAHDILATMPLLKAINVHTTLNEELDALVCGRPSALDSLVEHHILAFESPDTLTNGTLGKIADAYCRNHVELGRYYIRDVAQDVLNEADAMRKRVAALFESKDKPALDHGMIKVCVDEAKRCQENSSWSAIWELAALSAIQIPGIAQLQDMLSGVSVLVFQHTCVPVAPLLSEKHLEAADQLLKTMKLNSADVNLLAGVEWMATGTAYFGAVMIDTRTLHLLRTDEFTAVLAHELAHLKNRTTALTANIPMAKVGHEILADKFSHHHACPCAMARACCLLTGWYERPGDKELMNAIMSTLAARPSTFVAVLVATMGCRHEAIGERMYRAILKVRAEGHSGNCTLDERLKDLPVFKTGGVYNAKL